MDSLEWSRKYEVLSISRLMLRDELGLTTEQITSLTDEDMQAIADDLQNGMMLGFLEDARFATRVFLAEKRSPLDG